MSKEVFDDETILEGFKNLRDIIESQQQLNKLIDQRLKNLEASQFRQPLVLTKEMEVKNQRTVTVGRQLDPKWKPLGTPNVTPHVHAVFVGC